MTPRRLIEPARLAGSPLLRTQSDARLVDLVRAGHAAAFEAIVQRYRKPLLAYCARLLPASRAEDAVQQTFLKAYQAMVSGDAELNLRPWLYRIAHNASLNLLRQNGWSHEQLDENFDGVLRPDQALELRERLHATVAAVNSLPERQRNAVLLREVDGLTYEEIAAALGVGDGAVRQLLHRARATLRAGASAVTPVGLLERIAAAMASGGDPTARVAEVAAGVGAGTGAVKLGAAVLATGVLATGAITVPLARHAGHTSHQSHPAQAAVVHAPEHESRQAAGGRSTQIGDPGPSRARHSHRGSHRIAGHRRSGSTHHESSGDRMLNGSHDGGGDRHSGSGSRAGSGDGGGDHHSGSGSGDSSGSGGSHDGGGSNDGNSTPSSGDGSGTTTSDGGGDSHDGGTLVAPTGTTGGSGSTSGHDGGGDSSPSGDGSTTTSGG